MYICVLVLSLGDFDLDLHTKWWTLFQCIIVYSSMKSGVNLADTHIQTHRQTDRQTDRQTAIQFDRQRSVGRQSTSNELILH